MMKRVLACCLIASLAVPLLMAQQRGLLEKDLSVQSNGLKVVVVKDGVKHQFDVGKDLRAYVITDVKLLSAKSSRDFIYLLLDVNAASRGPENAQGECGVGEERNLVWLKMTKKFRKISLKSFPIESCWDGAVRDNWEKPLNFDGPRLTVAGSMSCDPSKLRLPENCGDYTYTVEYSLKSPEQGLRVNLVKGER
jgi:hypothetical protein